MTLRLLRALALGLVVGIACLWWLLPRGIGTLEATVGRVERDHADSPDAFLLAEPGARFEVGDGLRTQARSEAEIRMREGTLLKVRPVTLIRFRGGSHAARRIRVAHGELRVETVEESVLFETAAGVVRIAAHSRGVLREEAGQTRVDLVLGRAQVEWTSGAAPQMLRAGESASGPHVESDAADAGVAIQTTVEPDEPEAALDAGPATADDAAVQRDAGDAEEASAVPALEASGTALTPDVVLTPAPSLTLFDGAPPTNVRFAVTQPCPGGAHVEVAHGGGRFVAMAGLVGTFPVGLTNYRVVCGQHRVVSGQVRVVSDAGQRAMSHAAPSNVFDADGRAYTVLYQTRLPDLTIRWPSAAVGSRSTLMVEGPAGARQFPVLGDHIALPSGTLGDGEHRLWFQRDGSDLRSRTTRLEIRFDNATPLARLNERGTLERADDDGATLSGVVVSGARVSIRGKRVPLDSSGRFRERVEPAGDERGVAVKVELPRRSVVYFVRRFGPADATE